MNFKRNIALISFLIPLLVFSQNEFYNTGAVVCVQKGALLHVQGTITNNADTLYGSTGAFTNDGILELDGDFNFANGTTFQPDLSSNSTDRAVKFTGLGTQYIKGSGTATFYNLVLDKQSATDSVKMQTNVSVTGSLLFNTGTIYSTRYPAGVSSATYNPSITTGVTNNGFGGLLKTFDGGTGTEYLLDIQNTDTNAISGYPALAINTAPVTGYIITKGSSGSANGGLQRAIGVAASYVFPIGTSKHGFNAVKYNFTSVPGGAKTIKGKFCDYETSASGSYTGTIGVSCTGCGGNYTAPDNLGYNYYFSNDPCTGHPQWFILDNANIKHGYWTFTSSNNTAFTYSIEAFPNSITGPASLSLETWRMLKYDDGAHTYGYDPSQQDWTNQIASQASGSSDLLTWSLNTGCYSGVGIPGGVYTGFSEFALDKSNSSNALPVTIVSLEAYPVNNAFIQVKWVTSLEINNQGFTVQRSTDGVNFTNIGWVAGHDNSTQENIYTYNDYNVIPAVIYYYRLIQIDYNGHQNTTDIVQATLTGSLAFAISDFVPNPGNDHSKIVITTGKDMSIDINFYDVLGRKLSVSKTYNLTVGENTIDFEIRNLTAGNYTAAINSENQTYIKRLVIVR